MFNQKNKLKTALFLLIVATVFIVWFGFIRRGSVAERNEFPDERSVNENKYQSISMSSMDGWYIGYSMNYAVNQTNEHVDTGDADDIVLLKITHTEIDGKTQVRLQYIPIENNTLNSNLLDLVMEAPYISIVTLYKFTQELYSAKYQNTKNETSSNAALIHCLFGENQQKLLMRFEGLINQTFSICYVSDMDLASLISGNVGELQQKLDELEVTNIQTAENIINRVASQQIGQKGIPMEQ